MVSRIPSTVSTPVVRLLPLMVKDLAAAMFTSPSVTVRRLAVLPDTVKFSMAVTLMMSAAVSTAV